MITVGCWRNCRTFVGVLLSCVLLQLWLGCADASQGVMLAWDPGGDATVTGFSVYYGGGSGVYTGRVTVPFTNRATISGLIEGSTYYFAVTAHNAIGMESLPSNEVAYLVPGVMLKLKQLPPSGFPNAFLLASTGVVPFAWVVEVTENLRTWKILTRGTNSAVNVTVVTSNTPQLFFRVRSQ
jgi:hypothetical protein